MLERIEHWVVLMFENRSFDSVLGHLPHIAPADGIRDREIRLPYPEGEVVVRPTTDFRAPDPDPGEAYANVNVQLFGSYVPAANAGKSAFPLFPDFMEAPYNLPADHGVPTMDGFANDYYENFRWEKHREPTADEVQSIGGVLTPDTAPVINRLAQEYAVFTRWFCEAPTCTFPNRSFFHAGTSLGKLDNESIVNYAWDQETPNLFDLCTERGLDWRVYYDHSQIVPDCAINLAGLRHIKLWHTHSSSRDRFFADAARGSLAAYSWLEPNMLFGDLDDYHPPTDVRAGEAFLASVYDAVRNSPQWESTALVVLFDEHGGCYDHVPPPEAPVPDASRTEQDFRFDRFGVRVPAIVISPYTERGTVIADTFHTTSVLRTLRERYDLGPALTNRDAIAPLLDVVFNRSAPRRDRPEIVARPYHPPVLTKAERKAAKAAALGDAPDVDLLVVQRERLASEQISQLGAATLRNAARIVGDDPSDVPVTASDARAWLAKRFLSRGLLKARLGR